MPASASRTLAWFHAIIFPTHIRLLAITCVPMLAGLGLASILGMLAFALTLGSSVMLAGVMLMRMRLCLDRNIEVLSCLRHSMLRKISSQ